MTEQDIAVKLEGHEHEIGSLKHRVAAVEEATKLIQNLTINVEKLAMTSQTMVAELQKQGNRLEALEKIPGDNAKEIRKAVVTALIGGIIGAVLTKLLSLII